MQLNYNRKSKEVLAVVEPVRSVGGLIEVGQDLFVVIRK